MRCRAVRCRMVQRTGHGAQDDVVAQCEVRCGAVYKVRHVWPGLVACAAGLCRYSVVHPAVNATCSMAEDPGGACATLQVWQARWGVPAKAADILGSPQQQTC